MEKDIRSLATGTEAPNMGAGNQTRVHWKSSKLFQLLTHLSISLFLNFVTISNIYANADKALINISANMFASVFTTFPQHNELPLFWYAHFSI